MTLLLLKVTSFGMKVKLEQFILSYTGVPPAVEKWIDIGAEMSVHQTQVQGDTLSFT